MRDHAAAFATAAAGAAWAAARIATSNPPSLPPPSSGIEDTAAAAARVASAAVSQLQGQAVGPPPLGVLPAVLPVQAGLGSPHQAEGVLPVAPSTAGADEPAPKGLLPVVPPLHQAAGVLPVAPSMAGAGEPPPEGVLPVVPPVAVLGPPPPGR